VRCLEPARCDFGYSYRTKRPILEDLKVRCRRPWNCDRGDIRPSPSASRSASWPRPTMAAGSIAHPRAIDCRRFHAGILLTLLLQLVFFLVARLARWRTSQPDNYLHSTHHQHHRLRPDRSLITGNWSRSAPSGTLCCPPRCWRRFRSAWSCV
jgi:hypothetical protein